VGGRQVVHPTCRKFHHLSPNIPFQNRWTEKPRTDITMKRKRDKKEEDERRGC